MKKQTAALTQTQYGIYMESMAHPERTTYNIPFLIRLKPEIEEERLKAAIDQLVLVHPALDTKLTSDSSGNLVLSIGAGTKLIRKEMTEEDFAAFRKKDIVRPFQLETDALCRFELYQTPSDKYLFFDIHHLVFDGTSLQVMLRDLVKTYAGEMPEPEVFSVFEICEEETALRKTESFSKAKEFWTALLEGYDTDCLPVRDVNSEIAEQKWIAEDFTIDAKRLKELRKQAGCSTSAFFTTVMGYLIARYNYTHSSVISTIFTGRTDPKYNNTISMMVKTFPVVTDIEKYKKVTDLLAQCSQNLSEARQNTLYSFMDLASDLNVSNDINFAYQGSLINQLMGEGNYDLAADGVDRIYESNHVEDTKLLCELLNLDEETYRLHIGYRADYFSEEFICNLISAYKQAVKGFLTCENMNDIILTDEKEMQRLDSFLETEVPYDDTVSVVDMIKNAAEQYPEREAVVFKDVRLSYLELDKLTDRIGAYVSGLGIGREQVVSILIPRCEYMAAASIGVLKAGAAYQPLDPSYPPERLNFMVKDADAKLLIVEESLRDILSEYEGPVLYTKDIPTLPEPDAESLKALQTNAPKPEDLFILLYTSGSTGVPKGVMLTHGNLVAFCHWYHRYYGFRETNKMLAYASYGFDASMMDTYCALTAGGTLHILPEELRLEFDTIDEYIRSNEITHCLMTTQVGRMFAVEKKGSSLSYLSMGGEALVPFAPEGACKYINVYGPSECTVISTVYPVEKMEYNMPIGKSLENMKLYILDKQGHRVPVGMPGELCISGPQVSRGYLNRPEKTAEAYGENPFCSRKPYDRIYRSGDIAAWMPDGNIRFIGRRDAQVKIRGFRIELTEVEEIIRRFEGIKDATVVAYDDPAGGKYIAAYVVADSPVDIAAMNAFIRENKPPYMVPAVTMQIDQIPLTQNQKVNKKALPMPERKAEDLTKPENDTQQKIFDILSEMLGHDAFGIDTDFYEAGLSSISAIQLNVRLSDAFGIPFKISDIKENSTIRSLAGFIGAEENEAKEAMGFEVQEYYALTKTQEGVFAECMAHPGSTIYNIPLYFELDVSIDKNKLKKAITAAINAHPFCMTKLETLPSGEIRLHRDVEAYFEESMIEELSCTQEEAQEKLVKPYDLLQDRLIRAAIVNGKDLFLEMHHIISDGTSMNIISEDISRAYAGEELETEAFSGYEISLLEEKLREGEAYQKAKVYYETLLTEADTDCVPPKTRNVKEESSAVLKLKAEGSADILKQYCHKTNISMSTLFNGAFGYVLGKFLYKEDVLYTTVYNGRSDSRMQNSVSMLVKTFPVRSRMTKGESVSAYLTALGEQMLSSMANDIYSFAEISRNQDVSADILFTYQGDLFLFDRLCGKPCRLKELSLDDAKAMIDMDVDLVGDEIHYEVSYRSDQYDAAFIQSLAEAITQAAFAFTEHESFREISLLTPKMREKLNAFNATDYEVEAESVNCMFERQAAAHPEQTAVIAAGEMLSYDALNRLANRVAHALVRRGVGRDEIVGLLTARTKEAFIGEMAILKSGGAFLPMVPEYPDDRIDFCLGNAESRYILTTEKIRQEKQALFDGKNYKVLTFEELLAESKEKAEEENLNLSISPDALAYCIYTSGSTGTPKGVMLEHRNLRNFLDPNPKNPETRNYVEYGHVILSVISISFDFSLMELQLPLCNGLTVCMADEEQIHDPIALAGLMVEHQVDVMACTPSFIGNMIDLPQLQEGLAGMKLYDFGAEAFPPTLFAKIRKASPEAVICNGYGPTEATVSCIAKMLEDGDSITIGRPAANVKAFVCDKELNILPCGACGELVIGGDGVGRGYVKLPEKTAAVFGELNGVKIYRSGDVVRLQDDGEIEFFGRMDNQVKLRGFRVELDEIENNINTFPGINVSKVIVRNNGKEDYLAGFFTADRKIELAELTAHLKEKLTYYMVPAVLMQLDAMPLTVNGKIDKKKLPEVEFSAAREYVEPANELESLICSVYSEVLSQERVGATDSFFEIGGTSLTATIIVIRLSNEGYKIVYKDIFANPSPRELAAFLSGGEKPTDRFTDEFDYTAIDRLLQENTMEHVEEGKYVGPGNIILTGATGFLGIHILKEYLETEKGVVYCLARKGKYKSTEQRLKNMMMYYHGKTMKEQFENGRIVCIDGDITDPKQLEPLKELDAKTVINCAALVKHFVQDDSLDRINVHGVENLIELCIESGKRLVQISTTSVGGSLPAERMNEIITEDKLFFGQVIDNAYVRTKFLAERAVLDARAHRGLDGIIVRVGNLMSRNSDGEFQINFITNSFMRSLKAYKQLGAFPITAMHAEAEFSPIDSTASAILKLAGVEGRFSVYHAYNSHMIYMSDVIGAMRSYGFDIRIVSAEEFAKIVKEASKNDKMRDAVLGVIAYESDEAEALYPTESGNRFTVELLYRMNYLWPISDNKYLYNVIAVLDGFDFFELEE